MSGWILALAIIGQAQGTSAPSQAPDSVPKRFEISGQVSLLADVLPRRDTAEFRPSAGMEATFMPVRSLRLKFDGFVEGLTAKRQTNVTTGIARVREAWMEIAGDRGDIRAGYGRIVWGRLDEIQPTDAINPVDTARFIFEGRSAARLPVAFLRGRLFASESVILEGIVAPDFRRATFDELDEPTSPFNLESGFSIAAGTLVAVRPAEEPGWSHPSGGGRVQATIGTVDLSASVYRGFEGFSQLDFEPQQSIQFVRRYPRFTMAGADFETVVGDWAWRGEAAYFVKKTFRRTNGLGLVAGQGIDAGLGFDRRTGEYRVFGSILLHREWSNEDPGIENTNVNLVGSIERQFSRDRYLARAFAVVNPADRSGFVRGLFVWRVRDDAAFEASAAMFLGEGDDMLARFKGRDFVLTRLRWRF